MLALWPDTASQDHGAYIFVHIYIQICLTSMCLGKNPICTQKPGKQSSTVIVLENFSKNGRAATNAYFGDIKNSHDKECLLHTVSENAMTYSTGTYSFGTLSSRITQVFEPLRTCSSNGIMQPQGLGWFQFNQKKTCESPTYQVGPITSDEQVEITQLIGL